MKNKLILLFVLSILTFGHTQEIFDKVLINDPNTIEDWNQIWQSGFYQSFNKPNAPEPNQWFWGINMNHSSNHPSYRYNGQIAIKNDYANPTLYFRSTNRDGIGTWARVLHDKGNQVLDGNLKLNRLDFGASYLDNNRIELKSNNFTPYIDFSNDLTSDYDARLILLDDQTISLGGATLNINKTFTSVGEYDMQRWMSNHKGYDLTLKSIWNNHGIHHVFVQSFANTKYDALSFYKGNIGIGTTNPDQKLTVKGVIHAQEVQVDLAGAVAPDYVFEKYYEGTSRLKADYTMPTLEEVAQFTKEHKHLPSIPSAQELEENGMHLKEITRLLLQKIEELTLYTIEQQKEIQVLKESKELQDQKIQQLEKQLQ